jgi:hypothetical protein
MLRSKIPWKQFSRNTLYEEQIQEREAYLEKVKLALMTESERLEHRIDKTLERFNSDDSNAPLLNLPAASRPNVVSAAVSSEMVSKGRPGLQRMRSYSQSDLTNLKKSTKRGRKLSAKGSKPDPCQTVPSSPLDGQDRLNRRQDSRLVTLEQQVWSYYRLCKLVVIVV